MVTNDPAGLLSSLGISPSLPALPRLELDHALRPHLVHDTVVALPASDGVFVLDHVLGTAVCEMREGREGRSE